MFANGSLHLLTSVYAHAPLPGVYSSPLLLASSVWLFQTTRAIRAASAARR
jgi:hypothetical protein